jgi:hypothetical protein
VLPEALPSSPVFLAVRVAGLVGIVSASLVIA